VTVQLITIFVVKNLNKTPCGPVSNRSSPQQ